MKLTCRDIPQHGLLLVDTSGSFYGEIAPSFNSKWREISDSVQFPCLALLNESDQTVVAYKLLWNLERANGARRVDEKSFANIEALMGVDVIEEQVQSFDDPTIRPGDFRLFATTTRMPIDTRTEAQRSCGIKAITGGMPFSSDDRGGSAYIRATITIDGAFYSDGRFVGPDTTGYFAIVRAEVRAKVDLLHEISRHFESGRPLRELFEHLRADSPPTRYRPHMTAKEAYDFYRRIFTEEVLNMRRACGEAEAVDLTLNELKRKWPE